MSRIRSTLAWLALLLAIAVPIAAAATSTLLEWRDPIYIAGGFAGIVAMALMLLQPLLAGGYLPGLSTFGGRRIHRWTGSFLVIAVAVHVLALWITSPPDVIDALLFVSPTPFAAWGVIAMWAAFAAALLALFRHRMRAHLRLWRRGHTALVVVTVLGSVVHAMLIEGTMEKLSKTLLCAFVIATTLKTVADLRAWAGRSNRGA